MNAQMLLQSFAGGADEKTYVDDVFSTYLYTGNGATQTINNGIDLAGEGGLVWIKTRSAIAEHVLFDTNRGTAKFLQTQSTSQEIINNSSLASFNSNGFSLSNYVLSNVNGSSFASWTFRNAPKFFKCATVVKSAGSNATVDLSSLGTVGMVTVKRTDSTGDWYTWHRSLPAGQLGYLNQTAAASTLGHITVSGTTLTLVNGVIADGSYVVYAWAHDPSAEGIIQCGSFTTGGSGNATVNLGWEPQFLMVKGANGADDWYASDVMRETSYYLSPNKPNAEYAAGMTQAILATGFRVSSPQTEKSYIYLAIRRPNKPPKTGVEVFMPVASSASEGVNVTTGFPVDFQFNFIRSLNLTSVRTVIDRLRGVSTTTTSSGRNLITSSTDAESTLDLTTRNWGNTGFQIPQWSGSSSSIYLNFRRAPGFFDVVCYTGTGVARTVPHGLGVAPELMIVKNRSGSWAWLVYSQATGNNAYLRLDSTNAVATGASGTWNQTSPTSTVFTVASDPSVNNTNQNVVAYLFASLPGISKVGSYTGNGTSLSVECGFSTGARFILVKSIDDVGDWFIWDTARGIVAANDPHLSLNTTAVEVTTDDSVDPYTGGFIVNQNTATNININGKRYIFLAIA